MSYFADLTPYAYDTYAPVREAIVLNIGWLDAAYCFPQGETSPEFLQSLGFLCERPEHLHRGFHACQFCPLETRRLQKPQIGNGQIRVAGTEGKWYSSPTMIHHYVTVHGYKPPQAFIDAVLDLSP